MSRLTIAAISFLAGAISMMIAVPRMSVLAQAGRHPPYVVGFEKRAAFIPKLLPLQEQSNTFHAVNFYLDGQNSDHDTFQNVLIIYGGGPFRLNQASFTGNVEFQFTGAAANTVYLLKFIDAVNQAKHPAPAPPQKPQQWASQVQSVSLTDFVSPY